MRGNEYAVIVEDKSSDTVIGFYPTLEAAQAEVQRLMSDEVMYHLKPHLYMIVKIVEEKRVE